MAGKEGTDPLEEGAEAEETDADPLEEGAEAGAEGAEGAEGGEGAAEDGGEDLLGQASGGKKGGRGAPDTNAALAAAIEKLTGRLAPPQMTAEQQEAAWVKLEEETGMSRKAIIHQNNVAQNAALMASLPANMEVGRNKVKDIVDGDAELMAEVEEAMATLPPNIQANPKAWADAAYMALGKAKKAGKTMSKKEEGGEGKGAGQNGRRVIGGTGTAGASRSTGANGKGKETPKEYPAFEQHIINRQFGGDAAAYEKYKAQTHVESEGKITAGQGANAADKELERLTADNT